MVVSLLDGQIGSILAHVDLGSIVCEANVLASNVGE